MERTQTDRRARRSISRPRRQALLRDRRCHDRALAIRKFREWDRAMQRQHGALYYRVMGWTVH